VGTFALRHNKAFIVCKFKFGGCQNQGDQIGRIFPYWVTVYFGRFLRNYRSKFLVTVPVKFVYLFLKKTGWAAFWAIFSQAHLVTLKKAISAQRCDESVRRRQFEKTVRSFRLFKQRPFHFDDSDTSGATGRF
jgi:hypothetical protein